MGRNFKEEKLRAIPIRRQRLAVLLALIALGTQPSCRNSLDRASPQDFVRLMNTVADGWNEGNAQKAADCFADNAVYAEPPDRQLYVGRQATTKECDRGSKSIAEVAHRQRRDPLKNCGDAPLLMAE
jgi:hypothetical protein